jgi:hypothetical protein
MARTWSNAKRIPNELSAAQRARLGRPSSKTAFLIAMTIVTIFFLGLTLYSAWEAQTHPMTEVFQPADHAPKDE